MRFCLCHGFRIMAIWAAKAPPIGGSRWLTLPCRFAHKRARLRAGVTGSRGLHVSMADPSSPPAMQDSNAIEPGGVSRVAKGADCKSAASWLRRFESFLPHQQNQVLI